MLDSPDQPPNEPDRGAVPRSAPSLLAAFVLGLISVAKLDVNPLLLPRMHAQPMWFVAALALISCFTTSGIHLSTYVAAMVTIGVVRQTTDKHLPPARVVAGLGVAQQYAVALATLFLNTVFLLGHLALAAQPDPELGGRDLDLLRDVFAWTFYLVLIVSVKKKLRWLDSVRQTDALHRST